MHTKSVLFEVDAGIARVVLNRPDLGNAIDLEMAQELLHVALICQSNAEIRCVVLTGAGRMFCSGGDINSFRSRRRPGEYMSVLVETFHSAIAHFLHMEKPFVTLINGVAAGAGLSLAIAGDLCLAGLSAQFKPAHIAVGLSPDGGMTWLLPRLIGLRKAQEMILLNKRISAQEAESIGLITRAVEDGSLQREGNALANTLRDSATSAIASTRALLLKSFMTALEPQLENEAGAISYAAENGEGIEGVDAYLSKRPPIFYER